MQNKIFFIKPLLFTLSFCVFFASCGSNDNQEERESIINQNISDLLVIQGDTCYNYLIGCDSIIENMESAYYAHILSTNYNNNTFFTNAYNSASITIYKGYLPYYFIFPNENFGNMEVSDFKPGFNGLKESKMILQHANSLSDDLVNYHYKSGDASIDYNDGTKAIIRFQNYFVETNADVESEWKTISFNGTLYINQTGVQENDKNLCIGSPSIYISGLTAEKYTNINKKTVSELYAEYDSLCEKYPNFIRRANDICKVSNGTDSYDIRQYDVVFQNPLAINAEPSATQTTFNNYYNTEDEPKKILINSGMHGEEKAACWGTMLAIKELVESNEEWALFIKSNFYLRIIPCLNPYGFERNSRQNIFKHTLNSNDSRNDLDKNSYMDWVGNNKEALALIDSHGTQGKLAYVPMSIYMDCFSILKRATYRFSSAFHNSFEKLWVSIGGESNKKFSPYLATKLNEKNLSISPLCNSEMLLNYGLQAFTIETPSNLANGNRSDNDLRSCQITKTMLINYIQFVGTNF